ncbi:MFS transporter [Seminibacterium arietis]|uniref:MFS transporter n=1 Tax=Seminibacterium arietis TaxID=1173502 RepID=A0ABW3I8R9_9PAST
MSNFLKQYGFTPASLFQLALITVNAQLIYAFWDIRNSVPGGFPAALGVTDQQAGYLYSMQGLVIILGTIAVGWVGDRFSIRNIMLLSTIGVGGISLFLTLASPGLSMPVLLACFFSMLFFSEVLFKPANFKALRISTTEKHQGTVFGLFEFGRGLLAFLISLLWTVMLYFKAGPKEMMMTSCIIVIITGIAVFFIVPKDQKVGDEETQVHTTKEAIIGVGRVTKLPVIWIAGINVFCIYGAFVAAGTYFARFLQSGYGTSAVAAAVFAIVVIALRMLPLVSSVLVEKIFDSTSHFMRTMQIILVFLLVAISIIFFANHPDISLYANGYTPDQAPANLISSGMFLTLIILMLLAAACIFMIRGVYYAPIGEFGVDKKHSSAAMSFAITIGYIPALLAPIVLGGLVKSPDKDTAGQIIKSYLTDTHILGYAFLGLAVLVLISVFMSHSLIKLKEKQAGYSDK